MSAETNRINSEIEQAQDKIGHLPVESMNVESVISKLKELGIKYIDLEFPPVDNCVYNTETTPEYPFQNIIHWRRASDFLKADKAHGLDELAVFSGSNINTAIEPNDIK
jgi:hypothetical protein